MIVTINTDASFSQTEQRGSFAFWIRSDKGKIAMSGMLKKKVSNPNIAEFHCVVNAIYALCRSGWTGIDKIIVNTDSMNVIHVMTGDKKAIKKYKLGWGDYLKTTIFLIMREAKLWRVPIEFRHIKAHVSIETSKQWVNDWCDKEAKKQLSNFHQRNKNEKV